MARKFIKGLATFNNGFEVLTTKPLDNRFSVETQSDIYLPETWLAEDGNYYTYPSMFTVAADTGAMFVFIGAANDATDIADTTKWVQVGSNGKISAFTWKGDIGSQTELNSVLSGTNAKNDAYRVNSLGTTGITLAASYSANGSAETLEVGDILFCVDDATPKFTVIQTNIDTADLVRGVTAGVTDENIAVFDGTSGTKIKDSGFSLSSFKKELTEIEVGSGDTAESAFVTAVLANVKDNKAFVQPIRFAASNFMDIETSEHILANVTVVSSTAIKVRFTVGMYDYTYDSEESKLYYEEFTL